MKNLLLSHMAAFSLIFANTCSVNDDIQHQRLTDDVLTVTINNVEKTFNTLVINQQPGDAGNNMSGVINIEASIDNSPSEVLEINLFMDATGNNVIYGINYINDEQVYYLDYTSDVAENNSNDLSFDFFGNTWKYNEESEEKEIEFEFSDGILIASH